MEELKAVLLDHVKRYPLMEPTDAVKLIYQNEFGGGHLIRDEAACLAYLRRENENTQKDPATPACEAIGNGIIRVHLAAVKPEEVERLGKCFIRSAAEHIGSMERFLQKLELLRQLTATCVFSFGSEELESYLSDYEVAGYPAVSHSKTYRETYHPAYRIVLSRLWM